MAAWDKHLSLSLSIQLVSIPTVPIRICAHSICTHICHLHPHPTTSEIPQNLHVKQHVSVTLQFQNSSLKKQEASKLQCYM